MSNKRSLQQHVCSLSGPEMLAIPILYSISLTHPFTETGEVEIFSNYDKRRVKYYNDNHV